MTEKLRLDIPVVLPEVPDERDACVARLNDILGDESGITQAHVLADEQPAELCIHFDPTALSLSRVRQLTEAAGAHLTQKYGHFLAESTETTHPRRARGQADRLMDLDGVLGAEVSGAGGIRIEYDRDQLSADRLRRAIAKVGLQLSREFPEPHEVGGGETNVHDDPAHHGDDHGAGHSHDHGSSGLELGFAIAAGIGVTAGWLLADFVGAPAMWMSLAPVWAAYFFGGFFTAKEAFEHIRRGSFEIDFLMLAAAIGAGALGKWLEGGLLLFLFSLGHSLEHFAMAKARGAIESLADLAPQDAVVLRDGGEQVVSVDELQVGDRVRIKPNERVPADGVVTDGSSTVNQAPVTGESVPVDKRPVERPTNVAANFESVDPAHRVFAGTINGTGALTVQVTKRAGESALARVVQMVTEAETMRSPTQRFTDRVERYFVPSVLGLVVLLLFAFTVVDEPFADSLYRAMAVLVAASPCALAIATPSAVLSGVAAAGQSGVLVKGGGPLEHLGGLTAMAFDKTGTLTEGQPRVVAVEAADGVSVDDLLGVAVAVERLSDHPLAEAVVAYGNSQSTVVDRAATDLESITGRGVRARVDGEPVWVGKQALFDQAEGSESAGPLPDELRRQVHQLESCGRTTMIISRGQRYLGLIALMDTPRAAAGPTIDRLRNLGITRMLMISGDNQTVADTVAAEVGLDEARGDLMPEDKVDFVKQLNREGKVAMVGDGVNDAPAMANATVAIAMGAAGSDTALETAEIALMADELTKLPYALELSRKTNTIIGQNLWIALGMVAFLVPATILGLDIGPAVVLHEGSTLLVVFNALRLLAVRD